MTDCNDKTPAGCDPARGCYCENLFNVCHCSDQPQQTQAPIMGSALRYFLKRYVDELQPFAKESGGRVAASMLECCNHLLTEGDRLERGRY